MSAVLESPELDLVSAQALRDPYPGYAAWRESAPIRWSEAFFDGAWVVSRHADVDRVLRDSHGFSARRTGGWVKRGGERSSGTRSFQALFARAMLFLDAPDHGRLRRILNAGFRPALLQALAPRIAARVQERLDAVDLQGGFDFMQAIAGPIPAEATAMLMGIPEPEHARFAAWSQDLAAFIGTPDPSPAQLRAAERCLPEMAAYFSVLLQQRRAQPASDDLIGLLLQAQARGELQSSAELLSQCAMLLFAGYETTRNLLGNGLRALLAQPGAWARLRHDPQGLGDAVRELLRYDSPVQYTGRRMACDLEWHGCRMRRGELVIALIGAANRDPRQYPDPDRLDLDRRPAGLLSFGRGMHVCIGSALSQMEAELVFGAMLQRWPTLRLADEAQDWSGNAAYRGLRSLRLAAGAPATLMPPVRRAA